MGLQGKTAIIIGAGGGVGSAAALAMGRQGAELSLVYKTSQERAEEVAAELQKMDVRCQVIQADHTSNEDVQRLTKATLDAYGKIDILVNTAGHMSRMAPFVDISDEEMDHTIDVEFKGIARVCRAVIPHMVKQGWGRIITVGSDAGKVGTSGEAISAACRGAIIAFSKTLARELARSGICVNVVCLGPTDTPLLQKLGDDETSRKIVEAMIRGIPMRRLGKPEEIAEAIAFLASDGAGFITGQAISVSGGLTMC